MKPNRARIVGSHTLLAEFVLVLEVTALFVATAIYDRRDAAESTRTRQRRGPET